jgi:hypothetical protein
MKKKLFSRLFFLPLCLCQAFIAGAQSPAVYTSQLDTIPVSSFYKINLLPALVANCEADFRDLRIIENETGREVPYILKSDAATFSESSFVNFPIVSVKKEADKQTHIVLQSNKQLIDNLLLFIKNTEALRMVTLSGSDNNKDWFVIKENIYLDEYFNRTNDLFIQTLSFAPNKYAFYKLIIIAFGKYLPIAIKNIIQKDSSNKKSYIQLLLDAPHLVHKLSIQATGPKYFNRTLEISATNTDKSKYNIFLALSSNGSSSFPLPSLKSSEFLLTIQNDDNLPLQITNASFGQLNQYLLTYLDANKKYSLRFGDSTATVPVYDLAFFKDSIPASLSQLAYNTIKKNTTTELTSKKDGLSKLWMWLALVLAGSLLLIITIQLTRQINKKKHDNL